MKSKQHGSKFVVCVSNDECDDLEVRKIYQVIPDEAASADGLLRIVDESGEDYLYPASYFAAISLSPSVRRAVKKLR